MSGASPQALLALGFVVGVFWDSVDRWVGAAIASYFRRDR